MTPEQIRQAYKAWEEAEETLYQCFKVLMAEGVLDPDETTTHRYTYPKFDVLPKVFTVSWETRYSDNEVKDYGAIAFPDHLVNNHDALRQWAKDKLAVEKAAKEAKDARESAEQARRDEAVERAQLAALLAKYGAP